MYGYIYTYICRYIYMLQIYISMYIRCDFEDFCQDSLVRLDMLTTVAVY